MKTMSIVETKVVSNAQVVIARAAIYADSTPFSGVFEVWDVDHYRHTDPVTGKSTASFRCRLENTPDDEDAVLDFELIDIETEVIGYDGDVIKQIRFTDGCIDQSSS